MSINEAIKKIIEGETLTTAEAEAALEEIMAGECNEAQIAALLTALRMKGETIDELIGFARVMRRKATAVRPQFLHSDHSEENFLLDTCGTGGDVSGTFNISTAVAFVVAGCGLRVAKHGNRSVSSRSGSADVMEALGVKIDLTPTQITLAIEEIGIGYLHAPLLHEAMKYVAPIRKQLGVRTIFNMLGPLTNPAGATVQIIGVYAPHLTEMFAHTLKSLGARRALIVHGSDGLDEITITGASRVSELKNGEVTTYEISPEEVGLSRAPLEAVKGGDAAHNARMILNVLSGERGACRDIVLLNAAAALLAANRATTLQEGISFAAEAIDGKAAMAKLQSLIEFSNRH
jgi:anthranilate phosphoribosyltransferase